MWCPLTAGIVASQYPSSGEAALVTCYLTPWTSACLNLLKRILIQRSIFAVNLQTYLKVVKLILTPMIAVISHKWCQWFAWRVWWHVVAFVTHEITRHRAYIAKLSLLLWKSDTISHQNPHSPVIILCTRAISWSINNLPVAVDPICSLNWLWYELGVLCEPGLPDTVSIQWWGYMRWLQIRLSKA